MVKYKYDGLADDRITNKVYMSIGDSVCTTNKKPYIVIGSCNCEGQRFEHPFMGHENRGTFNNDKSVSIITLMTCESREKAYLYEQYARYKYVCERAKEQHLQVPKLTEINEYIAKMVCPELKSARFDKKRLLLRYRVEDLEEVYQMYRNKFEAEYGKKKVV